MSAKMKIKINCPSAGVGRNASAHIAMNGMCFIFQSKKVLLMIDMIDA